MPRHDIEQGIRRFLSYHLTNNKSGYDLYFHLEGEPCEVRRPLSKLFTTFRPSWFNGRKVPVHCIKGDRSAVAPAKTKLAVRKASQELPSTSLDVRLRLSHIKTTEKEPYTALTIISTPSEQAGDEACATKKRGQETKKKKAEEDAEPEPQSEHGERKEKVMTNDSQNNASLTIWTKTSNSSLRLKTQRAYWYTPLGSFSLSGGNRPLTLEGPEFGLEFVSDFFGDPGAPDRAINVRVDLDLAARFEESDCMRLRKGDSAHVRSEIAPKLRANSQQPYRAVADTQVMVLDKEGRILERSLLSPDFDAWEYGYVRLGTVYHTGLEETNNGRPTRRSSGNSVPPNFGLGSVGADTDHTVNNTDLREGSVSCTKTLLGYYFKDYTSVHPWLMLIEVQAWDFGDYCIGDPITCDQDHIFSEYDSYLTHYAGVRSMEELQKRVQRHILCGKGEPGSGIPFMPFYTHNSYDPAAYGLGVEGVSVHVVVRFVDKFTVLQKQSGKQPRLVLSWCAQYVFDQEEASYDITRITRLIVEDLRRPPSNNAGDHSHDGTRINSHTLLLKEPLKNLWTLQLWAMAQPQHLKKLYKLPVGRPDNMGCLGQFLDPRKVRLGDHRLYMEAHVVPSLKKA
ncbi:hypothetical protein LTR37_016335 [Vermiconidia calcicola]|uniref:Uncharacterized protein n=1 Tax=Vermiconidia calcicola TaxID=1690605 RepID=A0ACC3MN75_9PEZI|nr:hypothetical protein LTR37_016335 [Vermiconidia calcicola]